jgi:glycosyltransferase involved in cell wall biosynthesis
MKKQPTIIHLTASPCYGGPERQMLELGKELSDFGRSVYASFLEEGRCHEFIREAKKQGFPAYALTHDTPRLIATFKELKALLRSETADLLCCNGYKANLLGLLAGRRIGIPVISVSRGWTRESLRVRIFETLDRRILRRMDQVVCVSHAQARKVNRAGIPHDKITVIQDAVRHSRFENPDPAYRERLCRMFSQPPRFIVGAAGRLSPEKGYSVLVDAAAQVLKSRQEPAKPIGFILFGEGRLRESLARQIDANGLHESFVLAGFHSDLDQYLPHLDLLVQSSFTEGLPNIVLEACSAGVPVVATDVGGTAEILADGVDGYLVPPGDSTMLARRITDILSDDTHRLSMGRHVRQKVKETFSFASQQHDYARLVSNLIQLNNATSS